MSCYQREDFSNILSDVNLTSSFVAKVDILGKSQFQSISKLNNLVNADLKASITNLSKKESRDVVLLRLYKGFSECIINFTV
ncbi:MAG: hypothetical protein V7K38_13510 [Nostoc sp.]|uniref:hypothetical protein n=1 Tax=Nostoc sp. TaxID=1180 RepID=UPI002FFD00CA